jgi:hypothetical protein
VAGCLCCAATNLPEVLVDADAAFCATVELIEACTGVQDVPTLSHQAAIVVAGTRSLSPAACRGSATSPPFRVSSPRAGLSFAPPTDTPPGPGLPLLHACGTISARDEAGAA